MKSNLGTWDKILRIILALTALILYITGVTSGTLGIVLLIIGGILALTAFINYCPLYGLFGISTKPKH